MDKPCDSRSFDAAPASTPPRITLSGRKQSAPPEPSGAGFVPSSDVDHHLETAVGHPLDVERHGLGVHHLLETRVLHDLRVDPVSMGAGAVQDPGEQDGLATPGL